jgi:hypothetical protein
VERRSSRALATIGSATALVLMVVVVVVVVAMVVVTRVVQGVVEDLPDGVLAEVDDLSWSSARWSRTVIPVAGSAREGELREARGCSDRSDSSCEQREVGNE